MTENEPELGTDTGESSAVATLRIYLVSYLYSHTIPDLSEDESLYVSATVFYTICSKGACGQVKSKKENETKLGSIVIESRRQFIRGFLGLHGLEDDYRREETGPVFKLWYMGSVCIPFFQQ